MLLLLLLRGHGGLLLLELLLLGQTRLLRRQQRFARASVLVAGDVFGGDVEGCGGSAKHICSVLGVCLLDVWRFEA